MIPTNTIVRATLSSFSALTNKYRLLFNRRVTCYLFQVVEGGLSSSSMTLVTNFYSNGSSLSQDDLPYRYHEDNLTQSNTNLRYLSRPQQSWPLWTNVNLQWRASILFFKITSSSKDLFTSIETTLMRVNLHLVPLWSVMNHPKERLWGSTVGET